MTAMRFSRIPTPFTPPYTSPMKRNSITPSLLGRVGRKTQFGIFNISLQETYLPSLISIYAGIPLAPTNGKSILLVLWFTELL